jgi:hypothetical protein
MAALITLSMVSAVACGNTTGTRSSPSPPANSANPPTTPAEHTIFERLCSGLTWPRPLPAVVGLLFNDASDEGGVQPLTCLAGVRGVRPDGSVIYEHDAYKPHTLDTYQITAVSPPPGTIVGANDPVTVTLVQMDPNQPHVYHPCDWVTDTEAEAFLGAPVGNNGPIEGSMENLTASTDVYCPYHVGDEVAVISELRLAGARVVDAASEFAFQTAQDSTSVSGLGMKAACTTPRRRDTTPLRQLYVLLPGERIYVANGYRGESCDTLKQFAQAAIPRIGA